jgi:pyruvate formate lyase activating enzyme
VALTTGIIFNIQRFSIHDGPGIRTTVFFKGCPLRCFWCHNPEGLQAKREVQFTPARCIGCGACVAACPHGAQELGQQGRIYHRDRCQGCGACVAACWAEALQMTGSVVTAEAVMAEVLQDQAFYASSGGGVTLSGGEPLQQPDFASEILQGCRAAGLHTAVETTLHAPWRHVEALLPLVDLFLVDIKQLDPVKHRSATGVSNERILANVRRLAATGHAVNFRIPVVPTVNDTPADIQAAASFVQALQQARPAGARALSLELLPFHQLAGDKYGSLGRPYRAAGLTPPTKAKMAELVQAARAAGVDAASR